MDKVKALKALHFLKEQNRLSGDDEIWLKRLITHKEYTLYIDITDLCVVQLGNDEDVEYQFNVSITDIFTAILDSIGIGWEHC